MSLTELSGFLGVKELSTPSTGKHWCQNILKNPTVEIAIDGKRLCCGAKQVTDDSLRRQMLTFRNSLPQMGRVVCEIWPRSHY